jgi:hypothetical protein
MDDEPLWSISFREPGNEEWNGEYRTAARDLDEAIEAARGHLRVSSAAEVSVHATVPRSNTYKKAESTLLAMLVAVPLEHPETVAMLRQIRAAMKTVAAAKEEDQYIGPLRVELPIALQVDELDLGRPRPIRVITWGNRTDWPEWNLCTGPVN